MKKRFDTLLNPISKNCTVLEGQSQQTSGINERYFNNVKENRKKERKTRKKLHY